jgi:type I restriction enzyme R subunit
MPPDDVPQTIDGEPLSPEPGDDETVLIDPVDPLDPLSINWQWIYP